MWKSALYRFLQGRVDWSSSTELDLYKNSNTIYIGIDFRAQCNYESNILRTLVLNSSIAIQCLA